jgi:hypothetical protein
MALKSVEKLLKISFISGGTREFHRRYRRIDH